MGSPTRRPIFQQSPMPGLGLSMGITLTMLSLVVLLPIGALVLKGASFGLGNIWDTVNRERVWAALFLSFRLSFLAALFNLVFGVMLAWVLVRYRFPGRRLLDAAVDLPFALPTAVAGIALTALYAPNGAFGAVAKEFGLKIAYSQWSILIALVFVGLPFVTRTVQPMIEEIEREVEEASAKLGGQPRLYPAPGDSADAGPRRADGICAVAGAGGGGIRLGDIHRREYPAENRNLAPADRDPA